MFNNFNLEGLPYKFQPKSTKKHFFFYKSHALGVRICLSQTGWTCLSLALVKTGVGVMGRPG